MPLRPELLEELRRRQEQIERAGGSDKLAQRRSKGWLSARQRLLRLFQADTFQEHGAHVRHQASDFGMADKMLAGDGVIAGTGYVNGCPVAAFSQDFTVAAGTLGRMHAAKQVEIMDLALKLGIPLVAFQDSGGARIQEGVDALSGYGEVFYHNVLASGVIPQIAVIAGPCAGGAAYSPALMDFVIIVRGQGHMFITGPEVIKAVTGRQTSMEEVGGAEMHASVSGNAHFLVDDETQAVATVQELLAFLPANNTEDPPHQPWPDLDLGSDPGLNELLPADPKLPLDTREVICRLLDDGRFLEVHAGFAPNLLVGFGRLQGLVVGLVANQSLVMAGALDMDAADKAARFIRTCNVFNIPLVNLVDVPGFMPGVEQERGGIIRHGAKMLYAFASATVPKITVIMRKAYGGSYLAMCSRELGADLVYAWPGAEIAVMGAEGAVNLLYRKELAAAADRAQTARELAEAYRQRFASPYLSAARGYITDIIEPAATRATLALALRKLLTKREQRPAKKHGNLPL